MASRARTPGACALSVRIINRGHAIYTQPAPIKLGAMVIASFVQEAPMTADKPRA
ncbi:hypothetical protein AWB79_02236 [Caballeronia hypogeia]|uniref:Uncharacterized protein n=1 Tax=Caballeronia hypogeia TaxID=1777140 RepID=A0A158ADX2_9BURK|nr:DUF3331 domain-containing protein [Caballeronia hypogeia]SAK55915.1 hypothetical protein AWB79_02236 [Caballeronia hypogeia]